MIIIWMSTFFFKFVFNFGVKFIILIHVSFPLSFSLQLSGCVSIYTEDIDLKVEVEIVVKPMEDLGDRHLDGQKGGVMVDVIDMVKALVPEVQEGMVMIYLPKKEINGPFLSCNLLLVLDLVI